MCCAAEIKQSCGCSLHLVQHSPEQMLGSFSTGGQQRREDLWEAVWPWPAHSPLVLIDLLPRGAAGAYSGNTAFTLVVSWQLRQTKRAISKKPCDRWVYI